MTEEVKSTTRNSWLRNLTKPLKPLAEAVERAGFSANAATLTGLGLTVIGGVAAFVRNNYPGLGMPHGFGETATVLGGSLDVLDGKIARAQDEKGLRTEEQKKWGGITDAAGDRLGALVCTMLRAETARQRGDVLGESLALYNAVAQNLPSLVRGMAEWTGVAVPEQDFGSYLTRWGLAFGGTHFPTEGGLPIQPATEGLAAVFSTVTILRRGWNTLTRQGDRVTPEEQRDAAYKVLVLAGITGLSV